jgi:hypothetical protein
MRPVRRLAVVSIIASVAASVLAAAGPAAAPNPAIGFLHISPDPVGDHGMVMVTPSDPCPPPSAAAGPYVFLGDGGSDATGSPIHLANVPVQADGSWSASVTLSGPGWHALSAFCMASPMAEGAYAAYEATVTTVVPRSVGFWAAIRDRQAPAIAGDAPNYNRGLTARPAAPVVGVATDPADGLGYWTASSDGGVYTFGHASFFGSAGDVRLSAPVVGIAPTHDGQGYWLAAADGGVFTYGDAPFRGSGVGGPDRSPVVGIARTGLHTGTGYLLAHADGAVFSFTGAGVELNGPLRLAAPIVGIASTPSEMGYWLVAADGGVFTFGDAVFAGSLGGVRLSAPITAITGRFDGGYWLLGGDGGVFSFGGAPFIGSFAGQRSRFTAITATPDPTSPTR